VSDFMLSCVPGRINAGEYYRASENDELLASKSLGFGDLQAK